MSVDCANGSISQSRIDSLIFLGTATSGTIPSIACLTDPKNGCLCCRSSQTLKGAKNRRRNTSAAVRIRDGEGILRTIVIDVGKTFYVSAIEHFPSHGLRRLDAILLTHAHADAMNGLDDLRAWTLGGVVQNVIDIYCTKSTFAEVKRAFPYLVAKEYATGGGDLPEFRWHIIAEEEPFTLFGVRITPLPVHHGKFFTNQEPYICLGFLFDRQLAYLSDVSSIPEQVLTKLLPTPDGGAIDVLVIDVLRIAQHASHFGIGQAIDVTRRIQPRRSYWTGFAHRATHDNWLALAYALEAGRVYSDQDSAAPDIMTAQEFTKWAKTFDENDTEAFVMTALREIRAWNAHSGGPLWTRPACDGLCISWRGDHSADIT